MHQVYSSSVSPFHAKTGTPVAAMAAAAWSCAAAMSVRMKDDHQLLKMLQLDQV